MAISALPVAVARVAVTEPRRAAPLPQTASASARAGAVFAPAFASLDPWGFGRVLASAKSTIRREGRRAQRRRRHGLAQDVARQVRAERRGMVWKGKSQLPAGAGRSGERRVGEE